MSESLKKADALVSKLGLPTPAQPDRRDGVVVEWPDNIGDLTPDDLGEQMTWWTGWSSYARYHLARVETDLSANEEAERLNMAKHMFRSSGDYDTVTASKAAYIQRPDAMAAAGLIQELSAQKMLISALLEGYEKKYETISREISRRQGDVKYSGNRFNA